jgi:hypothetical protein
MGYQKPLAKWRLAPCQATRSYLPNVLALQVKISGGIKIYQALLHALVMPSNHAQGTIKFVQCTPIACLYRYRFRHGGCFRRIANRAP